MDISKKEWKQWNIELNESIETPTRFDIKKMDKDHYELYKLSQEIQTKKEELDLLTEEFKDLKDTLNPESLPEWAWIWYKKHSRVAWKQVVIDRLGQTYANKISASQKQKKYPQIGIRYIDPNPESIPLNPIKKKFQFKPKRIKLSQETHTPLLKLKLKA